MNSALHDYCWPVSRLGEALVELSHERGLIKTPWLPVNPPVNLGKKDDALTDWMRSALKPLRLEVNTVDVSCEYLRESLLRVSPGLVRLPLEGEPCFLAIVKCRRNLISVIGPNSQHYNLPFAVILSAIQDHLEVPFRQAVESTMDSVSPTITRNERAAICDAMVREQLREIKVTGIWHLQLSPAAPFATQLRQAGLFKTFASLISIYTIQYVLGLVAWWIMGVALFEGRTNFGWMMAWGLVLLTSLPLLLVANWEQGLFAIGAGALLKRRLLFGALRLRPEEMREQGAGQLLGRVLESQALESLGMNAGFGAVFALIELLITAIVLALGAGGGVEVLLFIMWIALALFLSWGLWSKCIKWTRERLWLTYDLVEKMAGHRTRLMQQSGADWHIEEDASLKQYLDTSKNMDERAALMAAVLPQGWLVIGLAGLIPGFISGRASPGALAIGLGGVMLASGALQRVCAGFSAIAGASIAWAQVANLFYAAARPEVTASPYISGTPLIENHNGAKATVLEARHVSFSHQNRNQPVLDEIDLRIFSGDRILLEGASGGGKSTLAAILSGLRQPDSGALFLSGLDMKTLGSEAWRRKVAVAPQYHENYVLNGTVAFNLLMGRNWPPKPEDLMEAEAVCGELGLDQLLNRMPSGLSQIIGENGWQLSHGERSRLFIARALLQGSEVIILDESLGTLDSENLVKVLHSASARARCLLVIAHP